MCSGSDFMCVITNCSIISWNIAVLFLSHWYAFNYLGYNDKLTLLWQYRRFTYLGPFQNCLYFKSQNIYQFLCIELNIRSKEVQYYIKSPCKRVIFVTFTEHFVQNKVVEWYWHLLFLSFFKMDKVLIVANLFYWNKK